MYPYHHRGTRPEVALAKYERELKLRRALQNRSESPKESPKLRSATRCSRRNRRTHGPRSVSSFMIAPHRVLGEALTGRLGRGPTRGPPQRRHQRRLTSPPLPSRGGPAKLWRARTLHLDQPQDDIAIGLARSAHRAEPVDPDLLQPDGALAPLVGLGLV